MARVLPDPVLTAGVATFDPSGAVMPTATYLGLSWPVELGGRRSARVAEAERARAVAAAELDDVTRSLRAEATLAWIDVLHTRQVVEQRGRMLAALERLVEITGERHRAGDVGEVAVLQVRVESERFRTEVLRAQGEADAAMAGLQRFTGAPVRGEPEGSLLVAPEPVDVEARVAMALRLRADVRAAEESVRARAASSALARANRWVDATLNVGWTHNFDGLGANASNPSTVSATPPFEQFSATLSVPLPFSRTNRGALDAAAAGRTQADLALRAVRLRAEVEVRQACVRYQSAVARLARYDDSLRQDAERVRASTLYTYQRGGATLLEVLAAQRTVDEVTLGYEEALADHARALVELERATGVWHASF
ncbi:MAG: TolC family protein [Polyangiales bacterium]